MSKSCNSPFEVNAKTAIWRKKSAFDEIELVEVFKKECDSIGISCGSTHSLPYVHELSYGVLVISAIFRVVLKNEILEGFAKIYLFGFFEAQRNHWDFRVPENKKKNHINIKNRCPNQGLEDQAEHTESQGYTEENG